MGKRIHNFGGQWTEMKLDILEKYLHAWLSIFYGNEKASYFEKVYVDAFAGTGYRNTTDCSDSDWFDETSREEGERFLEGSCLRALRMSPGFDRILLADAKHKHAAALKEFESDKRVHAFKDDANHFIQSWVKEENWKKTRAVVFLDPYGLQVDWSTLECIAKTEAIDLWLLFPFGNGISRMLTNGNLPPKTWCDKLTRFLGTDEWISEFYKTEEEEGLFGTITTTVKTANFESIKRYFVSRLETIFPAVAPNPVELRNSVNNPMFLFCFASANPKTTVKKASLRIASGIMKKF